MKYWIIVLCAGLAWRNAPAQKIVERYERLHDSLRIGKSATDFLRYNDTGYTLIMPDDTNTVKGIIISLESERPDLKNATPDQRVHSAANAKGWAVLYVSSGVPADFCFTDQSLSVFDTLLSDVFYQHHLSTRNIFLLGVGMAGNRGLRYIAYCKQGKSKLNPAIKGIALFESPLDWVRQWYESKKAIRDNFHSNSVFEAGLITYLFEKSLGGTPADQLQKFLDYSPYSYFDETNRNISYYKDLRVRAYTEPNVKYWVEARRKGYFDMNAPDMAGIINELKLAGNNKSELIVFCSDKEGRRNPDFTWGLADKKELVEWMERDTK